MKTLLYMPLHIPTKVIGIFANIQILPATGNFTTDDYCSTYSHNNESAHPGYYQVFLQRYGINAEMTSTLRCAYHRFTFEAERIKS